MSAMYGWPPEILNGEGAMINVAAGKGGFAIGQGSGKKKLRLGRLDDVDGIEEADWTERTEAAILVSTRRNAKWAKIKRRRTSFWDLENLSSRAPPRLKGHRRFPLVPKKNLAPHTL
ncbi:hypothetical protein BC937DRAFT_89507 [Endogone sp. FLAS-F59071]|nr:hypothetical protein BC937DRAFT_89507 [Endogone sp. FLAS-F59071]|eukprot:RUS17780.1 hypothetical protein BC937DRAFT_89507 [Endogone sp. FLAS-F59071]